ncbi:hypothetical protein K1W54_42545, partial [Micromonospora sp. CPCC 205371]|nr:hypothetical protein [Micromonospora sp. CPCC 205371]
MGGPPPHPPPAAPAARALVAAPRELTLLGIADSEGTRYAATFVRMRKDPATGDFQPEYKLRVTESPAHPQAVGKKWRVRLAEGIYLGEAFPDRDKTWLLTPGKEFGGLNPAHRIWLEKVEPIGPKPGSGDAIAVRFLGFRRDPGGEHRYPEYLMEFLETTKNTERLKRRPWLLQLRPERVELAPGEQLPAGLETWLDTYQHSFDLVYRLAKGVKAGDLAAAVADTMERIRDTRAHLVVPVPGKWQIFADGTQSVLWRLSPALADLAGVPVPGPVARGSQAAAGGTVGQTLDRPAMYDDITLAALRRADFDARMVRHHQRNLEETQEALDGTEKAVKDATGEKVKAPKLIEPPPAEKDKPDKLDGTVATAAEPLVAALKGKALLGSRPIGEVGGTHEHEGRTYDVQFDLHGWHGLNREGRGRQSLRVHVQLGTAAGHEAVERLHGSNTEHLLVRVDLDQLAVDEAAAAGGGARGRVIRRAPGRGILNLPVPPPPGGWGRQVLWRRTARRMLAALRNERNTPQRVTLPPSRDRAYLDEPARERLRTELDQAVAGESLVFLTTSRQQRRSQRLASRSRPVERVEAAHEHGNESFDALYAIRGRAKWSKWRTNVHVVFVPDFNSDERKFWERAAVPAPDHIQGRIG